MFQFYFKEKFDVFRKFRLLVSSSFRRVRKMQLDLVLFPLFVFTIFNQSFVSTAPAYGDSRGIGKVLENYFLIVPAVPVKCGCYNIGTLPLLGFSVA